MIREDGPGDDEGYCRGAMLTIDDLVPRRRTYIAFPLFSDERFEIVAGLQVKVPG
jgi:hypothetical protein